MNNSNKSSNEGLTLVEVLIATSIISAFLLALFGVHNLYLKTALSNGEVIKATGLAEESLEVMRFLRDSSWSANIAPLSLGRIEGRLRQNPFLLISLIYQMFKMAYSSKHRGFVRRSLTEGFTILEMLIYIAILVLMLVVIMNAVISIVHSGRIINALRNIETSAMMSTERLARELRQAESVNIGLSILGSDPGELVLEGIDLLGNPRTVVFYLSSGTLMLSENGVDTGALSQSGARVSSLIFYPFSSSDALGIKTEITIESGTSTYYRSEKFYSSAILR